MSTKKKSTKKRTTIVAAVRRRAPSMRRQLYVDERRGNLPYVVCWISLNGLPSISHFDSLPKALNQERHLKMLGREPSILVDLNQCEIGEAHVA